MPLQTLPQAHSKTPVEYEICRLRDRKQKFVCMPPVERHKSALDDNFKQ
jgi:hypothetical protein